MNEDNYTVSQLVHICVRKTCCYFHIVFFCICYKLIKTRKIVTMYSPKLCFIWSPSPFGLQWLWTWVGSHLQDEAGLCRSHFGHEGTLPVFGRLLPRLYRIVGMFTPIFLVRDWCKLVLFPRSQPFSDGFPQKSQTSIVGSGTVTARFHQTPGADFGGFQQTGLRHQPAHSTGDGWRGAISKSSGFWFFPFFCFKGTKVSNTL